MYLIYCENMDIIAKQIESKTCHIHIEFGMMQLPHTKHSQNRYVRVNLKRAYNLTEPQDIICSKVFRFAIHDLILNTFHMNAFEFSNVKYSFSRVSAIIIHIISPIYYTNLNAYIRVHHQYRQLYGAYVGIHTTFGHLTVKESLALCEKPIRKR